MQKKVDWLTIPADVLIQEIEGEVILLNVPSERYHALNETGRRFLEWAQVSESFDDAVIRIAGDFGIGLDVAENDLERLLSQLTERGLVAVLR